MIKIKTRIKLVLELVLIMLMLGEIIIYPVLADDIDDEPDEPITQNDINEVSNSSNEEPVLNSRRCVIFDRQTKRILYGKNENTKSAMASTTKIMTATIVIENADLNKMVTVTSKAAGTGGSRLGLRTNDKITIHDLLYGLLMRSGNDAAVALAIEVGGSVEGFAQLMNKKAQDLGLTNTHFVTPHGLDNPEHYTTAYELAKLTDYALQNKTFSTIVGTKNYTITINGNPMQLNNTNELLGVLNGVVGVKTGFTNNAGRCLVTETKRGDRDIITVVLGADTKKFRTKDSMKLIQYAYSAFEKVNVEEQAEDAFENWDDINSARIYIEKGKNQKIDLKLGTINTKMLYVKEKDTNNIKYNINTILKVEAPIEPNTKIGTLTIKLNDEIIEDIDIYCERKIEKKNCWDYFKENVNLLTDMVKNCQNSLTL